MTTRDVEYDIFRSAAAREQVRQAGHDPDSQSGERLVGWAKAQPRVPSVADLVAKSQEWNLPVQTPVHDPATVEQQIAEARANGDFETASRLQYAVDRVRNQAEQNLPTDQETKAINAARERAEEAQREAAAVETEDERMAAQKRASAEWEEASRLQLAAERRMKGNDEPPEPYPVQPTGGLTPEQRDLLEDEDTPLEDRLETATEQGDHTVASILQTRLHREQTGTVRA